MEQDANIKLYNLLHHVKEHWKMWYLCFCWGVFYKQEHHNTLLFCWTHIHKDLDIL